jgi:hypothetical protein
MTSNPDDCLIEPCVYCNKPVLVFVKSLIITEQGSRWTFCDYLCYEDEKKKLFEPHQLP